MKQPAKLQQELRRSAIERSESSDSESTLWQIMFSSSKQDDSSSFTMFPKPDDPIENHRKKKEAVYEKKNRKKQLQQDIETRGDESKRSGSGIWSKIRRRKTREEPEGAPILSESPSLDQADALIQSFDSWSLAGSILKNDILQRSATYRQFGGGPVEHIRVEETSNVPKPSRPDSVVVKVLASTITLQDCLIRRGLEYNILDPVGLPAVSGRDFVGRVFLCGENVTQFKPGDRVAGLLKAGGNAHYTEVSQASLVSVPKRIDSGEAACMVSVYATAYQAVSQATRNTNGNELEGKRVLVVGGMDGVGQAIVQICRKAKADVFVTAPDRRHAYIRSILKATPLPENSNEWASIVSGSMDYVFDGVCDGEMEPSFKSLNESGKCVCFGTSSFLKDEMGWFGVPLQRRFDIFKLETTANFEHFNLWESYARDPELYKANLKSLFQLLAKRKVKPEISKRVGLDEVALSHQKLEQGQVRGTVVCFPWKRVPNRSICLDKVPSGTK